LTAGHALDEAAGRTTCFVLLEEEVEIVEHNSDDKVTADGDGERGPWARRHKSAPSAGAACRREYYVWQFWLPHKSN
jgi:hypothetical protein